MRYWLTALYTIIFLFSGFAQDAVIFEKDIEINLNEYLYFFADSSGDLTIDDIRDFSSEFKQANNDIRLGVDETVAWLRLRIHNPYDRKEDAVIDFRDPSLYHITLYQINHDPSYSGTGISQEKKNIQGNRNAFILSLSSGETRELIIRVDSKNYMTLKSYMEDDELFFQDVANEKIFIGFFYGILFLIFTYSTILFFLTRFTYFIWYSLYIVVNAMFTGAADGLMPQYLFFMVDWMNGFHEIFLAALTNIVGLIFLRSYFRPCEWNPRLNKIIIYSLWVILGITIITVLVDPDYGFAIMRLIGIYTLIIYLYSGILGIRHKKTGSRIFFLAFAVFGLFILIFIANLYRFIPYSNVVQYSLHYGFLLSMVILSCALGVRIYRLYDNYLKEEQDKQQLIQLKNEELENLVNERTAILATKESQLRSILDNSINLIWLVNTKHELLEFNVAFGESWKAAYGVELQKGESLMNQYTDEESKTIWQNRYQKIFSGKTLRVTDDYSINGETRTYEILGVPIRNADKVQFAAVFSTDITERIRYEEQLKEQNVDLTKVNEELDRFVYSASHDLKAPLSSIQGLISLVKIETEEALRKDYFDMMEKSVKRLDQFIRDIIDYSRNTRVEITQEQIDITDLINSVMDDLHYMDQAAEFKFDLTIEGDVSFYNDETRLRIVFRNLMSNALRYGYMDEGEKRIKVHGIIGPDELKISIQDFGPGIALEHQKNVFKMFYRAHENSDGTGLGLYIVKETLEKMNGQITMESSESGTTFTLLIPNFLPK